MSLKLLSAAALAGLALAGVTDAQTPRAPALRMGSLTAADAGAGLKQALTNAADVVAKRLGVTDGYFGDAKIRIPLPGVLGDAQKRLKPFGMSGSLDDLQLRMNRAAEAAVPEARKQLVQAVSGMTIDDALGVLKGGETSATDFLRSKTQASLTAALRPHLNKALADAGALTALDKAVGRYGAGLAPPDTRGWLTDKATAGALDGLFYYVAQEERAIRRDPAKRTSDLLRRVFGG